MKKSKRKSPSWGLLTWREWGHIVGITLLAVLLTILTLTVSGDMTIFTPKEKSADYEISDFYQSAAYYRLRKKKSEKIVIVGTDECTQEEIIKALPIISNRGPAAIGMDLFFSTSKMNDSLFLNTFMQTENLVCVTRFERDKDNDSYFHHHEQSFYESKIEVTRGYANLVASSNRDVVRLFYPYELTKTGDTLWSFPAALAAIKDSDKLRRLIARNHEFERISFDQDNECWIEFDTINVKEILSGDADGYSFKDKFVLIGNIHSLKDAFLTPIKETMPGVKIHAYALHTILTENYITSTNECTNWIWAFLAAIGLIYFNMAAKIYNPHTGNFFVRIVQFIMMFLIFGIGAFIYIHKHIYFNFFATELVVGLSVVAFDLWFGVYGIYNRLKCDKKGLK